MLGEKTPSFIPILIKKILVMKTSNNNFQRRDFLVGSASFLLGIPFIEKISSLVNSSTSSNGIDQLGICTPKSVFATMEDWVTRSGNDRYFYQIEAVRIKKNSKFAQDQPHDNSISYLEAYEFTYNRSEKIFEADLEQVFSDRIIGSQRFEKSRKDIVKLRFTRDGNIKFTLKNWNNYSSIFMPKCANGILFGYDKDGLFWIFNFTQKLIPG